MDQSTVLDISRSGMQVALMVSLPVLAVALFVGVLVSVFQAITQVQEATLTFVPKLIGVGLVMAMMGGWMLTTLVSFVHLCFEHAARLGQ
ncbi:MAG TPA: flagellar biosynthesis protein FliQ [Fimbriimonadaceae bacterium]|nr:flagellar biosynthesis protein FliQ [Fimbriimonadaceae bacterium]